VSDLWKGGRVGISCGNNQVPQGGIAEEGNEEGVVFVRGKETLHETGLVTASSRSSGR
jgi:hypothetical protein